LLEIDEVRPESMNVWYDGDDVSHIGWMFDRTVRDAAGYAYFRDDRVLALSFITMGSLNLSEAFGLLGEPQLLWTRSRKVEGQEWAEVIFSHPSKGFLLEVDRPLTTEPTATSIEIREKNPVDRVTYFDPSQYENFLELRTILREPKEDILGKARPWSGMGAIPLEE
jgi:hypothetical protein